MLKRLIIKDFKCLFEEDMEFRNLTILTGENSSGKSSVIQAILFLGHNPAISTPFAQEILQYLHSLGNIAELTNKLQNAKEFYLKAEFDNDEEIESTFSQKEAKLAQHIKKFKFPNQLSYVYNLFYLNADRIRPQKQNPLIDIIDIKNFGIAGQYVASYFEIHKREPVEKELIKDPSSYTLETQVNYWLKRITGFNLEFYTEKISSNLVKSFYKTEEGFEFSPENIGIGVSYLVAILIVCLSAQKGNIVIIENPEIHLHPKSQAMLGEFFAFIASKGIQIIIETHNDHILNRIRYEVFKKNLASQDVIVYYRGLKDKRFEKIEITQEGFFKRESSDYGFPEGFYDATLKEIYEINRRR